MQAFSSYLSSQAAAQEKLIRRSSRQSLSLARLIGAVTIAQMLVEQLNAASKSSGNPAGWMVFDRTWRNKFYPIMNSTELRTIRVEDARLPVESIVEELLGLSSDQWTLSNNKRKRLFASRV